MSKLANIKSEKAVGKPLTTRSSLPFIVSFRHKLHKGYRFIDLEKSDIKQLQKFLDIAADLTVQEMDDSYIRKPDKTDTFNGQQIQHYGVGDSFRIHGVYEDQRFEVIRIDPNHRKHG